MFDVTDHPVHRICVDSRADTPVSVSRARILAAARQRFENVGYRRAGIADIARDAGVAVGTVYRYFKSKEDIFVEIIREANKRWLDCAGELAHGPGSALDRMVRLAQASLEFNQEDPLLRAIISSDTEIIFAPLLEDLRKEVSQQHVEWLAKLIREAIDEGSLRPIDPEKVAYIFFVLGRTLFEQRDYPYSELLPAVADVLLNGALKDPRE